MQKIVLTLSTLLVATGISLGAPDNPNPRIIGVGARALALAGNYTALARDFSALYYNPAGLGFVKAREAHVGLNGFVTRGVSGLEDSVSEESNERLRLSSGGLVWAVPTSRGGLALAGGYFSPYVFDEAYQYASGSSETFDYRRRISHGQLNQWAFGFGLQVAPGLSGGLSVSLLTGSSETYNTVESRAGGQVLDLDDDSYRRNATRSYLGYDVRVGFIYDIGTIASIGARFVFPRRIRFKGTLEEQYPALPTDSSWEVDDPGRMTMSYEGALSGAVKLPFLVLAPEVAFRAPDVSEDDSTDAAYWKIAAGIGAEVPVANTGLVFRAGYRFSEYDHQPMRVEYGVEGEKNPEPILDEVSDILNQQHLSGGLAYLSKSSLLFELSYGYTLWGYTLHDPTLLTTRDGIEQRFGFHQVLFSVSLRY
ncbi:MAG: hypothetical protein GF331_19655 [Chitinivibrionales bacterium]|nr:hypothetical protein [Chitinivibrionales bacterium]